MPFQWWLVDTIKEAALYIQCIELFMSSMDNIIIITLNLITIDNFYHWMIN